jgi:hypothetical protein
MAENKANYRINMIVANFGKKRLTMGLIYDCSQLWTEMRANLWSEIFFLIIIIIIFYWQIQVCKIYYEEICKLLRRRQ